MSKRRAAEAPWMYLQVLRSRVSTCLYDSLCYGWCKDREVAEDEFFFCKHNRSQIVGLGVHY